MAPKCNDCALDMYLAGSETKVIHYPRLDRIEEVKASYFSCPQCLQRVVEYDLLKPESKELYNKMVEHLMSSEIKPSSNS